MTIPMTCEAEQRRLTSFYVNRRNSEEKFVTHLSAKIYSWHFSNERREEEKERGREIDETFHKSRGGITRGIARFLLQIREIRKMTFRKVPRVRRAHRSYPIIVLILEKTIAREGETKNGSR